VSNQPEKLVTLGGEFFEATFKRKGEANYCDRVSYLFKLKDLTKDRGERLISLSWCEVTEFDHPDYDYETRLEHARLNALRRAFDSGILSFDSPYDVRTYRELSLADSDFKPQPRVSDQELKLFIMHKAYWVGFRNNPDPHIPPIQFNTLLDLEYLGAKPDDVKRYVWLLGKQGFLDKILEGEGLGRPTEKLIELYESKQSMSLPDEIVFSKGTQYQAFKEIKRILRSAAKEIFLQRQRSVECAKPLNSL
jgi:hypothetical protein